MSDWAYEGVRRVGLYRTAVHHSQIDLWNGVYQHWDGEHWGEIGLTPAEAQSLAVKPTKYEPNYWRLIKEGEQHATFQLHDQLCGPPAKSPTERRVQAS